MTGSHLRALLATLGLLVAGPAFALCTPGDTQACTVCGQQTVQICGATGQFPPCSAPEICNNCDDDLDGFVDNAPGQGNNTLAQACGNTGCGLNAARAVSMYNAAQGVAALLGMIASAPGRVAAIIRLTPKGWTHMLKGHSSPGNPSKSQFSISPAELEQYWPAMPS